MKKVLLILCVIFSGLVQAQNTDLKIWESQYSEYYEWDADSAKYLRRGGMWEETKFTYTREFFAIELKEDKVTKIWWAYYNSPDNHTDCYYTENDAFKICVNTKDEEIAIWQDSVDGRFNMVWVLSKIHQVKKY